ncbi:MAG: hypothetical protein K2X38_06850 [Gemmataceae bacterium]|nr:hypothetical protein [Gemmataceae bacterium]
MRLRLPYFLFLIALTLWASGSGCTRRWFRERTDKAVNEVLADRDVYPFWKIENANVYPDPRARFADPTNPDRPPMPPDDPAAKVLSPSPQRPYRKSGIARVEGTGYIDMLTAFDCRNRAEPKFISLVKQTKEPPVLQLASMQVPDRLPDDLPPPRAVGEEPAKEASKEIKPCRGYLITLEQAVELGLVNSREYQSRREDLYLAALPVTFESFGLGPQAFFRETAYLERTGKNNGGAGSRWRLNGNAGAAQVFSTGALLLFNYANQTVINLSGVNAGKTTSVGAVNLDLVQPLLRGGGRAVTLEPLTQAERNLLYQIRLFSRFRKEFFQNISGLGTIAPVATPAVAGVALVPGNVVFGTTNPATLQLSPSNASRLDLTTFATPTAEGFLPSVLKQALVDVEEQNVTRLEEIFRLFQAYEGGGDVSSLQVGQVQSQLLQARATVLQREQESRNALDRLKLQIGIPVDIPIELEDSATQPLMRQFQEFETSIRQFEETLKLADRADARDKAPQFRGELGKLMTDSPLTRSTRNFRARILDRWARWDKAKVDDKTLTAAIAKLRKARNDLLDQRANKEQNEQAITSQEREALRRTENDLVIAILEQVVRRYESLPWNVFATEKAKAEEHLARFRDTRSAFADVLTEASTERIDALRARWPSLPPVILSSQDLAEGDLEEAYVAATKHAIDNRLELMNARATVVDTWRQLRIQANALLGVFNVGYSVDSSTPPTKDTPLAFRPEYTRHQLVLNFQAPIVRLAERNAYRASLIAYQRSRRNLMALEDTIANQIRVDLRNLQVLAKTYRIQQQAVELAFQQVESSLETFRAPPVPNVSGNNAASAAALTQQLLGAYARLPQVQTQLLTSWTNYRIARQQMYLDLELLPLDPRGVWIDEFANTSPFLDPR